MKNFSGFKYQKSVLRTVEEPPVKKKFNWDRFFFVIALVVIAGYFVRKIYNSTFYMSVDGLVIMDKTDIHFTEDIRMQKIYVHEGDAIDKGDTLFSFRFEDIGRNNNELNNLKLRVQFSNPDHWFLKEKLNTKRQIATKQSEKEGLLKALKSKQKELDEQKKLILLGVDIAYKLPPIEAAIARLETDKSVLEQNIKVLRKHLYNLRKEEEKEKMRKVEQMHRQIAAAGGAVDNELLYSLSPIEGLIGRIYKSPKEVCYESENVMVVHQLENLKIKAYFEQKFHTQINIGDEVLVEFPDGQEGRGIIYNFYVSTYPLPPEFQKKYEPVRRSIVVDVVPANEKEASQWSKYYKMAVKVHKSHSIFDQIF